MSPGKQTGFTDEEVFVAKEVIGGKSAIPLSKAIRAGDFVYVSGQLPFGSDGKIVAGGIEEQTRATLENVKSVLAEAGCQMSDVVKSTVFIVNGCDFAGMNKVYAEYFPDAPPTRSTIICGLVIDAKLEIEAIAYKPR